MLEEETERFYKIQLNDETNFWDKYDWCVAQVQSLMLVSEVHKVSLCRKLIKLTPEQDLV